MFTMADGYVAMNDVSEYQKSKSISQDTASAAEEDHYISMDQIRVNKKSIKDKAPPTLEDVYDDPLSVVSSDGNTSPAWDTPSCSGTTASGRSSLSGEQNDPQLDLPVTRKVVLHPGSSCIGMSIAGGVNSPKGLLPVFITDIDPGGLIDSSHMIQVGDTIVSVNGEMMSGKTHRDVVLAIKAAGSSLMLEVTESPESIKQHISLIE